MHNSYYGILAGISLVGLLVSFFGPVGESQVGLLLSGGCNGFAIVISCRQRCKHAEESNESRT